MRLPYDTPLSGSYVYSYDRDRRLTRITFPSSKIITRTYAYDAEDHLTSAGAASYTYDKDGFLTGKTVAGQTTGYQYSSRGELLQVDLPSGDVVTFVHDPLGRRIAKKRNGTAVEKYLWQGRTRLLAVYDGSGALTARFEYADGRLPVAMTKGSTRYFLVYDQVGSLRAVLDSSGGIVKTVEYDSFGNVIADSNSAFKVPFGFAGGLFDSDTGLTRFGYRDYDADVGRWTAKDPIGFEGGDTDLYGYVVGDPVNGIDPEGTFVVVAIPLAGVAVTALANAAGVVSGVILGTTIGQHLVDNILESRGKGERNWEKGRGDDEFWDKTPQASERLEAEVFKLLCRRSSFFSAIR